MTMVPTMMMQCVERIPVVYTYQVGVQIEYSNLVLLSRYPDSTCGLRYS